MQRSGISRRRWLQAMGLAATAGGLALPGVSRAATATFAHGVASGDPLQDAVILWTRVSPDGDGGEPVRVRWEIARDAGFSRSVAAGEALARPERDFTVKVDATGLAPGNSYFYRFRAGEETSPTGRTRTLPAEGAKRLRLAVVSCANYPQGYFNVYRAIAAERDLDAVLHLGDYFYEYPQGGYANDLALRLLARTVRPEDEVVALDDYRMRYALYRADPDLQAVHAAHPMIAAWDDHESANNSWKGGAENHDPERGEGLWAERRRAAVRAYHEWMPTRESALAQPAQLYRHFDLGGLADLFMLETRLIARDEQLTYGEDLLYREVAFDLTDPEAPRPVRDPARIEGLAPAAVDRLRIPFDLRGERPVPILDYRWVRSLEGEALPEGIAYLPDAERFRSTLLERDDRHMLGAEQLAWLEEGFRNSRAPWQILGQQVLMGRLRAPNLLDVADFSDDGFLDAGRARQLTLLGEAGLPLNLDSWDGYPAARERLYRAARGNAPGFVSLAGDTHNAWAFDLADESGAAVGVEFGAPSVSSPGMETYIPAPPGLVAERFVAANPELAAMDSARRGWLELEIGAERLEARWRFVSTVLSRRFQRLDGAAFALRPGARKLEL